MASEAHHLNTRLESPTLPIILRVVEIQDAPHHAAMLSSPDNGGDPDKPFPVSKSEQAIPAQRESASVPTILGADGRVVSGPRRVNMVVCLKTPSGDEQVIGLGGYGAVEDREHEGRKIRAGDVGVLLNKEHRGKGYAAEAMRLAMDWGFSAVTDGGPQMDLVTLTTLADNKPMSKLAEERLGLKDKWIARPAGFDATKQELYMEVKPEEWKEIREHQV